jgi:hydrogenase maturation factor HypF (carbamoyltransferase family)
MPKKSSTAPNRRYWSTINERTSDEPLIKPETKRVSATAIREGNAFDATMHAVIIYDEFDYATKAKAMLERAAHRTDKTTHCWSVRLWRVDVLKLPPAAEAALAEAVEAHLIMLAVRQVQSLLPWLMDWLERWATRRQIQEAALAVCGGGSADTRLARATPELSQFAGHHGLSLIFDGNALVEDKSSMVASNLQKPEDSLTPTRQHILEQPVRDDYEHWEHWGLND